MDVLSQGVDLVAFFRGVTRADARMLILDYDGTLAPFRTDRRKAKPYPEVAAVLREILASGRTRVIVVSGRTVDDLMPLLEGIEPIPEIWGSHGAERRTSDGRCEIAPIPNDATAGLKRAVQWARNEGLLARCDLKPSSIALHWRGLDESTARDLETRARRAWQPICEENASLFLQEFDGGLELRTVGMDKGRAVRTLLSEAGPQTVVAYLGDDLTDEDAFKALAEDRDRNAGTSDPSLRLSVLVRSEDRPTAADVRLEPPGALVAFLRDWMRAAENGAACGERR